MKKIITLLIVLCCGTAVYAATSATGSSTVRIVSPINIAHRAGASLNFGGLANGAAGTVIVDPAGTATSTGLTYYNPADADADSFDITASAAGQDFSVVLPSAAVTLSDGGSNTVTVESFTATCTSSCVTTSSAYNLRVGATLRITSPTQATGIYIGSYTVTLVY